MGTHAQRHNSSCTPRDWHECEKFTTTLVILSAPKGITIQLVWWSPEVTDKSTRISHISEVVVICWAGRSANKVFLPYFFQYSCFLVTLVPPCLNKSVPLLAVISFILLGEPLRVCAHAGPSCCTSKMEDSYMAAVRSEMQHKMRSYSFELKYLIDGHRKAYQGGRVKEEESGVDDGTQYVWYIINRVIRDCIETLKCFK